MKTLFLLGTLSLLTHPTFSEKILVVSFFASKSHKNVYEPLYIALAERGHSLTLVTPIKSTYPSPASKNLREINGLGMHEIIDMVNSKSNNSNPPDPFDLRASGVRLSSPINPFLIPYFEKTCELYYAMPQVQALLKQKFALVIISSHMNECAYGLLHKLNTSYIFVHPHSLENYKSVFTGLRALPSFVPSYAVSTSSDKMPLITRTLNFLTFSALSFVYDWIYLPKMEASYRRHLGHEIPSAREIEKNASLAFMNGHFSISGPRPMLPVLVDVAGMHCRPGQPLPQDLTEYLDASGPHGFVLFSMGSHLKASKMPDSIRIELITAFSKLKQRVLWKWDEDTVEGLTESGANNVKVVKWVPQQDVLAHPNIKAFISHGGLLSVQESVYHGVPLIGLPVFGDQINWNLRQAERSGYGILLEILGMKAQTLVDAVNKVSSDPSYRERAKSLSKVFQDQPQKPLDVAVYWTEYVMRHKGAVHLRSGAADLPAFSYYCLDVIAILSAATFITFYVLWKLLAFLCSCCCSKKVDKQAKTKLKHKKTQ